MRYNNINKYGNKKITVNGKTYASHKEYERACELQLMEKAGLVTDLQEQVPFLLIPAQYETYPRYGKKGQPLKDGRKCVEQSCVYIADFVYKANGLEIVEDAKGKRTADYIIKRKLMLYNYGIRIREV